MIYHEDDEEEVKLEPGEMILLKERNEILEKEKIQEQD